MISDMVTSAALLQYTIKRSSILSGQSFQKYCTVGYGIKAKPVLKHDTVTFSVSVHIERSSFSCGQSVQN